MMTKKNKLLTIILFYRIEDYMNLSKTNYKILNLLLRNKESIVITVEGNSMEPTLRNNDLITVSKEKEYGLGDILVFIYKSQLLVHRMVRKGAFYFCKGDNSFRIEDITQESIVGKVTKVNGIEIKCWELWKINLSFDVGKDFKKNGYDLNATKECYNYKFYSDVVIKNDIIRKNLLLGKEDWNNFNKYVSNFVDGSSDNEKAFDCFFSSINKEFYLGELLSFFWKKDTSLDKHINDMEKLVFEKI